MSSTEKSSADRTSRDELRSKVIGLGEKSFHKNYYGKLQRSIHDLELSGAVLEQISDIIVVIDKRDTVINANQAACSFFERDRNEIKNISVYDLESIPFDTLKADDTGTVVLEGIRQEKRPASFLLSLKQVKVAGEDYRVLVGKDVSHLIRLQNEQRMYESQLLEYQKTDMVSFLAGSIAHDFNNILTGIIGFASMLSLSGDIRPGSEEHKTVEMILDASGKASDLVSNLMSISRKGSIRKDSVSLAAVVTSTIEILKHTVDETILIDFCNEADDAVILGNASALHSAVLNMGINAGHAIDGKGRISFTLSHRVLDENYCRESPFSLAPGEYLKLTVEDTGSGIPAENLDRIFDALYTTKEAGKGTGLGLSSVMRTVKEHCGEIRVASTPGEGTVFTLLFPDAKEKADIRQHRNP